MLKVCALYLLLWVMVVVGLYFAGIANELFSIVGVLVVYVMQMLVYHGEQPPNARMPGVVVLIYAMVLGLFYCGLVYGSLNLLDILARITRYFPAFMYRHGGVLALLAYLGSAGMIFLTGRMLPRYSFVRLTLWTLVIGYAAMTGIYQVIGHIWPAQMNLIITDDIETIQFYTSRGLALILAWVIGPVGYLWANRHYRWRMAMAESKDADDLQMGRLSKTDSD